MMKIAVTHENGQVFPHFGHCKEFKVYETDGQHIIASHIAPVHSQGHGALAGFLKSMHIDTLICGSLGGSAKQTLGAVDITVYPGISGPADSAVYALLTGQLLYSQNVQSCHHEYQNKGSRKKEKTNCNTAKTAYRNGQAFH
ncbi:MAG: dinitrogenase iron-molybdenum cofactor biosynthesis protein [Megasphaera sp.]|jgi:predicted Fe-Mo cluster-binding NifX family protein|nr:dinitrogenase iron-molybdenum cofactor biosynthesis protein [Megasphaera sp.]MCH4187682.1 dinitrogenase iron-molybdenum cofactor biosynthesis protein [Megasphaera sp.]MCH4217581.1 dinitrogenase iron-molybdenum cofactor biosynthesis protein [Megasphaera sp.]